MPPDWYGPVQKMAYAAKYLNCSVFELEGKEDWVDKGFAAYIAEKEAANVLERLAVEKAKSKK